MAKKSNSTKKSNDSPGDKKKKSYYKPKGKKVNNPEQPVVVQETVVNEEEILFQDTEQQDTEVTIEKVPEKPLMDEVPVTPISANDFCRFKCILGQNKKFIEAKYGTKVFSLETWEQILIKEKIRL